MLMRAAHSLCMSYKRELNENKKKIVKKGIRQCWYNIICYVKIPFKVCKPKKEPEEELK